MRTNRIKADGEGYYHVISRIVNRDYLMDAEEKDFFVGLMRRAEKFSAVQVLTFAVLDNHFHILVRVPEREEIDDDTLLERYGALYGETRRKALERKWEQLRGGPFEPIVTAEQEALKKRMYDVSEFVKTLKMRYTISYNTRHERTGTLWEERFKSVLVEPNSPALHNTAKYIDLNAVRARIVTDPSKYRWCGYGEACRGVLVALAGIEKILPPSANGKMKTGADALLEYRSWLGGQSPEVVFPKRVCRFTDGLALGGEKYIGEIRVRSGFAGGTPDFVLSSGKAEAIYALRRARHETVQA